MLERSKLLIKEFLKEMLIHIDPLREQKSTRLQTMIPSITKKKTIPSHNTFFTLLL